jgi:hypothetical protein
LHCWWYCIVEIVSCHRHGTVQLDFLLERIQKHPLNYVLTGDGVGGRESAKCAIIWCGVLLLLEWASPGISNFQYKLLTIQDMNDGCERFARSNRTGVVARIGFVHFGYEQCGVGTAFGEVGFDAVKRRT